VIPKRIDRYQIIEEVARGGMATVLHARDPRFKRDVALKLLPRPFVDDSQFRARFQREAQTIASLEHEAIVPVYDSGEQNGQPYLVMRFMAGGSLAQRIARGPMELEEAASVLVRVASGLDHAHGRGVIHRDLKPGNVLFDSSGLAYLSDFGIAQISEATISLTVSGAIIGTPAYMSPEQVQGDVELDARSDVYALGIILFEMLTGQQPYRANTPTRVMMKHVLEPVPHVRDLDPALPPAVDQVVARTMAKERSGRFPTAGRLADALVELLEGAPRPVAVLPVRQPPPVRLPQPTTLKFGSFRERIRLSRRIPTRGWIAGSILGLVGVAALIGGSVFAARGLNHTTPTSPPPPAQIAGVVSEPSNTPSPSPTTSPIPTTTPTATPVPVLLTIQTDAVCRLGPGVNYDVAGYLTSGQAILAHGRNAGSTWWWIEDPIGDRACWVSALLVTLNGDGEALPVLTPGPTSTAGLTVTPVPSKPIPSPATTTTRPTKAITLPPPGPDNTPTQQPTPRPVVTRTPKPAPATPTATTAPTEAITLPPPFPGKETPLEPQIPVP
jgi:serine/threonine protein kinase